MMLENPNLNENKLVQSGRNSVEEFKEHGLHGDQFNQS